ncbi:MAG: O-antigen ligase family protein [Clostridiales bacterium]|nr:O-antigen ligase family protein [Clostridiales bacterium]
MEIKEKSVLNILRKFLCSNYYPIALTLIAVICHVAGLDVPGYIIFSLCGIAINLFLSDCRPIIPTFIIAGTCTSAINAFGKGEASSYYSSPVVLSLLVVAGALVIISAIAHIIIYKSYRGLWAKLKKSLTALGIAILCVAMLVAGLFSGYIDLNAFIISGTFVAILVALYLYILCTISKRSDNIDYVALCIMLMGIAIACQVLSFYAFNFRGQALDSAWKDSLLLGAYVSNSAGEMMVITLPVYFMFAYKKKHGWAYILGAVAMFGVVLLTLSRASMLFAVPVFIFGLVWCCFKGNYKKFSRIFTCGCIVVGIAVVALFLIKGGFEKIGGFFGDTGLADRGRFSLWSQMIECFKQFPIFGAGFSVLYQLNNHASGNVNLYSALAHNTIFQMIGSCGIVGILAYAFHRFTTIKMFVKKYNSDRLFMGITMLTFLLLALLDQIFFFPHFIILYAILLAISEIDYTQTEIIQNEEHVEPKEKTEK